MFRNCLAAALRHLSRNPLYTAISVAGLAIGLCTALIAALVIHNQYTYDHFVPGYGRTYIVQLALRPPGLARQYVNYTQPRSKGGGLDLDKLDLVNARLSGHDIPETLAAIDSLWRRTTGSPDPLKRFFLDEHIELLYQSVLRQSQAFGICALIAVALSCIGLFALTAATAERRTKEIGIRKALGASTGDVVRLLLWQFSKPVVWASLVAWPVAAYAMSRWLAGFAYHVSLPLWMFPAAALAALLIALATVSAHSVLVARARPVEALRYE